METRTITEVRIYFLVLNDMKIPHIESGEIVAIATNPELIQSWYNEQRCAMYTEEGTNIHSEGTWNWNKSFRKGSDLEWYNPEDQCVFNVRTNYFGHGIHSEWILMSNLESVKGRYNFLG